MGAEPPNPNTNDNSYNIWSALDGPLMNDIGWTKFHDTYK